jgi:hypothetical protein
MDSAMASLKSRTAMLAAPLALAGALAGCVSYSANPLPTAPSSHAGRDQLKVDVTQLRLEPLKPVVVDARDGLDPTEIAVLAVLNSP